MIRKKILITIFGAPITLWSDTDMLKLVPQTGTVWFTSFTVSNVLFYYTLNKSEEISNWRFVFYIEYLYMRHIDHDLYFYKYYKYLISCSRGVIFILYLSLYTPSELSFFTSSIINSFFNRKCIYGKLWYMCLLLSKD